MARFANSVLFNPSAGGTADFVVSSAVQGYMTPALAGAPNGVYKYRAESADLSQWEIGEGTLTGTTLARTTVLYNSSGTGTASGQSGAGTKINFSTTPQVGIVLAADDVIGIDQANTFTSTQRAQARSNINAVLKKHLVDLTISTAGSSTTFTVAAGEAADSTGVDLLVLVSSINKTMSAWAVGSGNGGLDTGTIATVTWYYVFLIKRPDTGVVDVLFSLSPTAPTLPANYTLFRRIGTVVTNGTPHWNKVLQFGDYFMWDPPINNVNNQNPGTSGTLYSISVPPAIQVTAELQLAFSNSAAGVVAYVDSPLAVTGSSGVTGAFVIGNSVANLFGSARVFILTSSGQIFAKSNAAGGNQFYATILGWIDKRGKE